MKRKAAIGLVVLALSALLRRAGAQVSTGQTLPTAEKSAAADMLDGGLFSSKSKRDKIGRSLWAQLRNSFAERAHHPLKSRRD